MKKILIFGAILGFVAGATAYAAVRDGSASLSRAKSDTNVQARTSTTVVRSSSNTGERGVATRVAVPTRKTGETVGRAGVLHTGGATRVATRPVVQVGRNNATKTTSRAGIRGTTVARAAVDSADVGGMAETRTGAAYNQCKAAYFQCMDQFCQLKNDDYRRCSCSDRVKEMAELRKNLTETGEKLTEFTENLDMVGMTAAQATALHTASDGENALAADTSASKALLTAIMNSIRGNDATVAGKMSDLNSINLSFDTSVAFGNADPAQVIASYDGTELYSAVYPSCRAAVAGDCTNATLQRAVNAYLMAIEQDCNTVQTAIVAKQRDLKSAIREGSAMLDLARVENRKKHNSDDLATCIANVEAAVLSEQVCGANYHKCLDNGEFIDVSTGAPITGVVRFYELAEMLKFDSNADAVDQKLAQNPNNLRFVKAFENKTKKFAHDALDKCVEIADTAWSEYLDKALLDIYYAQRSKVDEIKRGCFDFISTCYADRDAAITAAMAALVGDPAAVSLQPDKIILTQKMCSDYIDSCNNMFGEDIVANYMDMQAETDTLAACRAVVQQCFDDFGGANYENFYYPASGLFVPNTVDSSASGGSRPAKTALDWFSLYSYDETGKRETESDGSPKYVSECARRVAAIPSCRGQVEEAFGGFDAVIANQTPGDEGMYAYTHPTSGGNPAYAYGLIKPENYTTDENGTITGWTGDANVKLQNRRLRGTGVATEVYNQIIDVLTTQCMNVDGRFVEAQFINHDRYGVVNDTSLCSRQWETEVSAVYGDSSADAVEYMCTMNYEYSVDTAAWGICSCWENGGRRSKNGLFTKCVVGLPVVVADEDYVIVESEHANDRECNESAPSWQPGYHYVLCDGGGTTACTNNLSNWCESTVYSKTNQVCPFAAQSVGSISNGETIEEHCAEGSGNEGKCECVLNRLGDLVPEGIKTTSISGE
ncbi:MAG: hypothetical protein J6T57_00535 [Alphaproteobacteria bacterium]|nr:hypothetical protein [Alphaproteobacteria bacterium]